MYALSIAFVIFIYVSYDVNVKATQFQEQQAWGSLYKVYVSNYGSRSIVKVAELEKFCDTHRWIEGCAWVSGDIAAYSDVIKTATISNVGRVFKYGTRVFATAPNFLDVSLNQFLVVEDMEWSKLDLIQQVRHFISISELKLKFIFYFFHFSLNDPAVLRRGVRGYDHRSVTGKYVRKDIPLFLSDIFLSFSNPNINVVPSLHPSSPTP